ncbi:hypothetical protein KSF_086880 [Reticulibacter mediterranei]|uniref:Uncharacterized protein n=1 Tax=Reticulibacter mediterranei TaxID=2778369 RepID=A0A8J3IXJ4_9CHLR|nr:hypothetical protein [Reticulibacter mediterranei]GHO98640.1 hypothetical protein KSF_086880 [Reticulibacter mediterranei]
MKKHRPSRSTGRSDKAHPDPPAKRPRQIIHTQTFRRALQQLAPDVQRSVQHKIAYLAIDPRHPSLHVQRVRARPGTWMCSVSRTYRLLYHHVGHRLILQEIGRYPLLARSYRTRS